MPYESRGAPLHRACFIEIAGAQPAPHIVDLDTWGEALDTLELAPADTAEEAAAALEAWAGHRSPSELVEGLTSVRFYDAAGVEELRQGGIPAEFDARALWIGAALVARRAPEQGAPVTGSKLVVQLFNCQDEVVETDDPDQLHDFCVRLLRDAEPVGGPLSGRYTNAAVHARTLPRELRSLLGVRVLDHLDVATDEVPAHLADSWWARDEALATAEGPVTVTTLEILVPLVYPPSMVAAPFDSAAR